MVTSWCSVALPCQQQLSWDFLVLLALVTDFQDTGLGTGPPITLYFTQSNRQLKAHPFHSSVRIFYTGFVKLSLVAVIKGPFGKAVFSVHFVSLLGALGFGLGCSKNRQRQAVNSG